MAKNKNKDNSVTIKRHLSKRRYSRKEFINIFCRACKLCLPSVNPLFCFNGIYLINPQSFATFTFKKLLNAKFEYNIHNSETEITAHNSSEFKKIFCPCERSMIRLASGYVCTPPIVHICLSAFRGQKELNKLQANKIRSTTTQALIPYPTVIYNNNEEFKNKIYRILHGDNIRPPDNDERSAYKDQGFNPV